jgi:hypothetical protein
MDFLTRVAAMRLVLLIYFQIIHGNLLIPRGHWLLATLQCVSKTLLIRKYAYII